MDVVLTIVMELIAGLMAFIFVILLSAQIVKLLTYICNKIDYFCYHVYWKIKIWWNGWAMDVPDYYFDDDAFDAYIDSLIQMELGYLGDTESDDEDIIDKYIIFINPNGNLSIGTKIIIN